MAEDNTFCHLVVIGSSAGGIEALSELVATLPEDFPAPIVIAQHLDPERPSHLEQILSRHSALPVRTITDNAPLKAGVIFVVPSNHHLSVTDTHIGLTEDTHGRPMPSVDLLFSSASASFGERKRAEEALRESEERLRRTIAIETVGVIFFKTDGRITEANDAFLRMSGYDREDLAQGLLRWDAMTPPEWMPRSVEAVEELQTTGRTTPYEKEYIRKDGSRWWGLFAATGLSEEESIEFVIDVTSRKRAEEERERLVAHEVAARAHAEERRRISRELHDRVAHDMALVHQSLELYGVLRKSDPERAASKIELARRTVKRTLDSTRNLSAELSEPDVRRGLEAALADLLRDLVPPHVGVDFSVSGEEALVPPETRNQLFLILREAIRNAVTHSGCSRITVGLGFAPNKVVGSVEDDGRGFDVEEAGVAGVGLRSMKERTALLGGELRLAPEPGTGTKVVVSLPLAGGR